MTPLERFAALDRPLILGVTDKCDALIVLADHIGSGPLPNLALVVSPLGKAMRDGEQLLSLIESDPTAGAKRVSELEAETRKEMSDAIARGAIGIFYFLDGACPDTTTPMQYGGHFLEVDRRLMQEIESTFNVVYVNGKTEPYIDFVSDLAATGFAWDIDSGVTPEEVRKLREGAIMGIDFELQATTQDLRRLADKKVTA